MSNDMSREWPEELDALTAAPANHRLLLENERVRVLETVVGSLVRNVSPAANERRYGAHRTAHKGRHSAWAPIGFRSAIGEREFAVAARGPPPPVPQRGPDRGEPALLLLMKPGVSSAGVAPFRKELLRVPQ